MGTPEPSRETRHPPYLGALQHHDTHTHTPQRAGDACCRQVYMIVMDEAQIYLKGKEGKGPCNDRCATMVSFLARAQYDVVLLYPRH